MAVERHPDVVFLDELEARRVANVYVLHKTGVIGILIRAKLEGRRAHVCQGAQANGCFDENPVNRMSFRQWDLVPDAGCQAFLVAYRH